MVWGDALLVLHLGLYTLNRVRGGLHLECDGLARERAHKNLHATTQSQHQVQRALLLNVVVGEGATILQLLARKDQALLVWRNALLVLHLRLDTLDRVHGLHLECDGLARERAHENLHATT